MRLQGSEGEPKNAAPAPAVPAFDILRVRRHLLLLRLLLTEKADSACWFACRGAGEIRVEWAGEGDYCTSDAR